MAEEREVSRRRIVGTAIAGVLSLGLAGCGQISEEVQRQVDESTDSDDGSGDGGNGSSASDESGSSNAEEATPTVDSGSTASLTYGDTYQGAVDDGDGTAPGYGELADAVTFEGESGDTVEITMTSGAFDTYLVLQAPDGSVVAQNDDRQQDFNSEIVHTLTQSGTYTVWCSSFSESSTGAYQLTVERTN